MKISSFLFHILSFLPIHPVNHHNHILISDIQKPIEKKSINTIQSIDTLLYFHTHPIHSRDDCIDIYLPRFFKENTLKVDSFQTSLFHYQNFKSHKFSKHITYEDFCILEKQISLLVEQYLKDNKHHYGIILDDIFLNTEGIHKYWNFQKNYILIRDSTGNNGNTPDYVIIEKIKDYNFL